MPELPGGGAEKVLIDILRRFDRSSYDLTLLLLYDQGVYVNSIPKDVKVIALHEKNSLGRQRFHRLLKICKLYNGYVDIVYRHLLNRKLRGSNYDIIISFLEGAALRMHSYILDRGIRNYSWVHIDLLTKHWSADFFRNLQHEKQVYEKMDKIAFVSEEAKSKFIQLFNYDKNNLSVIYNLIPRREIINNAKSEDINPDRFTIILIGRLNAQKAFHRAVKVASKLKNDKLDFQMWILGEGELRTDLQNLIESLNLNDKVKLLGFKESPYPYLRAADIYLSTSYTEGLPLTLCEALCLGKPCISTATTGPSELLGESEFGMITDHSIESIYAAVNKMMTNDSIREKYAMKAIERSNIFVEETTLNKIYNFINS